MAGVGNMYLKFSIFPPILHESYICLYHWIVSLPTNYEQHWKCIQLTTCPYLCGKLGTKVFPL